MRSVSPIPSSLPNNKNNPQADFDPYKSISLNNTINLNNNFKENNFIKNNIQENSMSLNISVIKPENEFENSYPSLNNINNNLDGNFNEFNNQQNFNQTNKFNNENNEFNDKEFDF